MNFKYKKYWVYRETFRCRKSFYIKKISLWGYNLYKKENNQKPCMISKNSLKMDSGM